jgi:hypothetical protein
VKKCHIQVGFEQPNLLAQRRLRHFQLGSGPTEMKLLCNSDKVSKLTKFHGGS